MQKIEIVSQFIPGMDDEQEYNNKTSNHSQADLINNTLILTSLQQLLIK